VPVFVDCFAVRPRLSGLFVRCIAVVFQGQYWASTEQMGYVIDALSAAPSTRVINAKGEGMPTPREEQIVNLVAEGIGNREIARSSASRKTR
jgi:DNA-binding NarL/FixJ family response regulator